METSFSKDLHGQYVVKVIDIAIDRLDPVFVAIGRACEMNEMPDDLKSRLLMAEDEIVKTLLAACEASINVALDVERIESKVSSIMRR